MIEQDTTSRLKIRILPLQEKDAISFIAGAVSDLTMRHNVVAVPNTKDTEELAQKLHSILGLDIVPVKDFDNDFHANSIIYQQHFDTLCNASDIIKGEIKSRANHEGARNFSSIHNQVHQDETCPYFQQNMTMSKLYRKGLR